MSNDDQPVFLREGASVTLLSPTAMPNAGGFLWNKDMMVQMTCRGFATAQFLQPEPAKYSRGPVLEATTFMQPEHPYYAHHSGRFFYVKNRETGALFSAPYEPVRAKPDSFAFTVLQHQMQWRTEKDGLRVLLEFTLPIEGATELWRLRIENVGQEKKDLSIYPAFSVGYLSWMNQAAAHDETLSAIIASYVTPYQKVEEYFKHKSFKENTFLLAERSPDAWCARLSAFEGEGGLQYPDGIAENRLGGETAEYEVPVAALQYDASLDVGASFDARFVFGAAKDKAEIKKIRDHYFGAPRSYDQACAGSQAYVNGAKTVLQVSTPNAAFDHFVNNWMARQVFYHGSTNRLTTDPQTRNYLQDHMGMCYVRPESMRTAISTALAQQRVSGEMPDGVLLHPDASLKYINQVPHTDHCVWLPICIKAYLNETADYAFLQEEIAFADSDAKETVLDHITRAMRWLAGARDERGLSYIAQGDWCDPMNMVGYKGNGVSGWLTLASAHACGEWSRICADAGNGAVAHEMRALVEGFNGAANRYFWDGRWYARGITDEGKSFGVADDEEGRIFLNPQAWAMLSGAANAERSASLTQEVERQLKTPYGVMMLAPAYTGMREDVGRVTQKFPGSAENGSIYNHAAAFYASALYAQDRADQAFAILSAMLPNEADCLQRQQLPVYIPNYYRGAFHQFPRTAGRSSQLFNTGTIAWFARIVVEQLFGLEGCAEGLKIHPQLPSDWSAASATRLFRGATFRVTYKRGGRVSGVLIQVDGRPLEGNIIRDIRAGQEYKVDVFVPQEGE